MQSTDRGLKWLGVSCSSLVAILGGVPEDRLRAPVSATDVLKRGWRDAALAVEDGRGGVIVAPKAWMAWTAERSQEADDGSQGA
jgi:hypothetical protein